MIERFVALVRETVPAHAQQILDDPAWDALATAGTGGHQPPTLLRQAADQRTLDEARSLARTLTWRIHRLAQRPAPSARARADTGTRPSHRAQTVPLAPHQPTSAEAHRRPR